MAEIKESKVLECNRFEKADFQSQHGKLYAWYVKFENGDEGKTNTKTETAKFIVGNIHKYEKDEKKIKFIDKDKSLNANQPVGEYKKKQKSPELQHHICYQVALECTNMIFKKATKDVTKEDYYFCVNKLINWIIVEPDSDEDKLRSRSGILKRACEAINIQGLIDHKISSILDFAEELIKKEVDTQKPF